MAGMNEPRPAIEEIDRYIIPVAGRHVSRLYLDSGFGILFFSHGPNTEVRIEGVMSMVDRGNLIVARATEPNTLVPFLGLYRQIVRHAFAFKNGKLEIEFDNNIRLEVEPGERYETWEISTEDGLKVVSIPGGSIDFWQANRKWTRSNSLARPESQ